jgi:para-aminobenzoate synthetase component I
MLSGICGRAFGAFRRRDALSMLVHHLPYHHDSARLFARVAQEPWAIFLDSGQTINSETGQAGSPYGRYDIIVARPSITLVTRGEQTVITRNQQHEYSGDDPFKLLNEVLGNYSASQCEWPFSGGALGYFAYDLARRIERLDANKPPEAIPEMMIGIYDWAVVVDHKLKVTHLVSHGFFPETKSQWDALCSFFEDTYVAMKRDFEVCSAIESNFTQTSYAQAFTAIQDYITAGDCYQVNLAQRFSAAVQGDGWTAYQLLRKVSPAPFMAFMQLPIGDGACFQVMSNSPERFIQCLDRHVETRPIKGTRPRSKDLVKDAENADELQKSIKDRAENLMIVDLLRNDIGKNCVIGSVKADKLFQLQSFVNVHHLVSIISGTLNSNATTIDLLRGCFPGGSITGAPKVRSMEIIEALEPHRRGIYCGAIGYIGFDGNMDTNIAIRTATIIDGKISFYAGGGIVTDSECDQEYSETLDKAASMTAILRHFMRK